MKKNFLKEVFSLPYKEFFGFCLLVNIGVIAFVLVLGGMLPPVVPLMYGLPVGEEQLVAKGFLTIPSAVSVILIIVNVIIAKFSSASFIQKVLVGLTIAITLLSAVTTMKIFFLVASF